MSESAVYFWITVFLCLVVAALFFASRRKVVLEKGITTYYQLICVSVFIWLFFTTFLYSEMELSIAYDIAIWRYIGIAFMPSLTAIHIWHQLSTVPLKKRHLILLFLPPMFTSILAITNKHTLFFIKGYTLINPETNALLFDNNWGFYLHCGFSYIIILFSLLLIMRIYFRIPRHMRKTIVFMVYAAFVPIICNILILLFQGKMFPYDITIFGTIISLYIFYCALKVTRSSNLIITSREYVWDNLSSTTLILDADGRILDYNKSVDMEKLGLPLPILMESFETFRLRWIHAGNGIISKYNHNIISFVGDAQESHFRIRPHDIKENGQILGSQIEISEITEIYTLIRYLEDSAQRDHLTGLNNRNAFIRMAPQICRAEYLPLLVVIGDVNDLKEVNDEQGHIVGDKLIQVLANILTACAPPDTFIFRIGGDEFILMFPQATKDLEKLFMDAVHCECAKINDESFGTPSVSLGAAYLKEKDQVLHDVINDADRKMYLNKRNIKGTMTRCRYNQYLSE